MLGMLYNMQKSSGLTFLSFVICFLTIRSSSILDTGPCMDEMMGAALTWRSEN